MDDVRARHLEPMSRATLKCVLWNTRKCDVWGCYVHKESGSPERYKSAPNSLLQGVFSILSPWRTAKSQPSLVNWALTWFRRPSVVEEGNGSELIDAEARASTNPEAACSWAAAHIATETDNQSGLTGYLRFSGSHLPGEHKHVPSCKPRRFPARPTLASAAASATACEGRSCYFPITYAPGNTARNAATSESAWHSSDSLHWHKKQWIDFATFKNVFIFSNVAAKLKTHCSSA